MKVKIRRLAIISITLLALCLASQAAEMRSIDVDGSITITYPADLEPQAQQVKQIASENLVPIVKSNRAAFNEDAIYTRIIDLLGKPEIPQHDQYNLDQETLRMILEVFHKFPLTQLSNIRLVKESDIRSAGTLTDGCMTFTYCPQDKSISWHGQGHKGDTLPPGYPYVPVFVKDDGSMSPRHQSFKNMMVNYYRFTSASSIMMAIHETTEGIIIVRYKLYHPYTRWFNDGMANYAALTILKTVSPEIYEFAKEGYPPLTKASRAPHGLNLPTWLQKNYLPDGDTTNYNDQYNFATVYIARLFSDQPEGTVAKVLHELDGKVNPGPDEIFHALDKVTGKDSRRMLLDYAPKNVRDGFRKGTALKLISDARKRAVRKDYRDVMTKLTAALEIMPDNMTAHFNLAWVMRKAGAPQALSEQQINILAHLQNDDLLPTDYAFCPDDAETLYIEGRFLQIKGKTDEALARYQRVLAVNPTHADAQAAIQEIKQK